MSHATNVRGCNIHTVLHSDILPIQHTFWNISRHGPPRPNLGVCSTLVLFRAFRDKAGLGVIPCVVTAVKRPATVAIDPKRETHEERHNLRPILLKTLHHCSPSVMTESARASVREESKREKGTSVRMGMRAWHMYTI